MEIALLRSKLSRFATDVRNGNRILGRSPEVENNNKSSQIAVAINANLRVASQSQDYTQVIKAISNLTLLGATVPIDVINRASVLAEMGTSVELNELEA